MDAENINFDDLKILVSIKNLKIHVIGDTIVDTNHY